jgi:hypothetical protein
MKVSNTFLLVSFLCTSAATAAVHVFPNFLSSKDVDHYRQEAARKKAPPSASSGPSGYHHQLVSTVTLKEHVHDMVRTALLLGTDNEEEGTYWVKKLMSETQAPVTTLTRSTKSHVDYYQVRIYFVCMYVTAESFHFQSGE